jgi:DNA-binding CsgD family transcriptional regulator
MVEVLPFHMLYRMAYFVGRAASSTAFEKRCLFLKKRLGPAEAAPAAFDQYLDNVGKLYKKAFLLENALRRKNGFSNLYLLLSRREAEIAGFLLEGHTPAVVSRLVGVRVTTVERHISNLYLKLRIRKRQDLRALLWDGGKKDAASLGG